MAKPYTLPVQAECPDAGCKARLGGKHGMECTVAICVSTGVQRLLHQGDVPPPPTPGLPVDIDVHICGEDRWGGYVHGAESAIKYGLFVQPASHMGHSPGTPGWVRCEAGDPGAVPDIARLMAEGTWNPIFQTWELRREKWIVVSGVGGYVCAEPDSDRPDDICGMPVETEPCTIHHPDDGE